MRIEDDYADDERTPRDDWDDWAEEWLSVEPDVAYGLSWGSYQDWLALSQDNEHLYPRWGLLEVLSG